MRLRPARIALSAILAVSLQSSCSGQGNISRLLGAQWYPLVTGFFKLMRTAETGTDITQQKRFLQVFTPVSGEEFLAVFGGHEAFRAAAGAQSSDSFPWPGRFKEYVPLVGKHLAAARFDRTSQTALATTFVTDREGDIEVRYGKIYRFHFVYDSTSKAWKILNVEFVRNDPTVSNIGSVYVYAIAGFAFYNGIALLPFLFPLSFLIFNPVILIRWTLFWYQLVFFAYIRFLNGFLDFGKGILRRFSLPFFMIFLCPVFFFCIIKLFALVAANSFNSHIGFLVILLVASSVLGIALLRESYDYFQAKAVRAAISRAQAKMPLTLLGLYRPRVRFDVAAYRRVAIILVLLVISCTVIGVLPYRDKFKPGVTSEVELVFTIERRVETHAEASIYRIPSFQDKYTVGRSSPGDQHPLIDQVEAGDGPFYRVVYGQRSVGYIPSDMAKESTSEIEFRLEGDYINYLAGLGQVVALPTQPPNGDQEARIIADAYLAQALRAMRLSSLSGLTQAITDLNRAIEFDSHYGMLYAHRAFALAGIARILKEDCRYNLFGLSGKGLSTPSKANVLLLRALENVKTAARFDDSKDAATAAAAVVEGLCGRTDAAERLLLSTSGQHAPALRARLLIEKDPERATVVADQLLRLEPDDARTLNDKGLLQARNDRSAALETFGQVVRISPDFIDGRVNHATCRMYSSRGEGLAEIKTLLKDEKNFTNRIRFQLSHVNYRRAIALLVLAYAVYVLHGLIKAMGTRGRMGSRRQAFRTSVGGAFLRVAFLVFVMGIYAWGVALQTVAPQGAIGTLLPPLLPW